MYADYWARLVNRPLVLVLAVAAILAPLLTAGAAALFFASRHQDGNRRGEIADVRRANARLFDELVSQTAAKNAAASKVSQLRAQVASLSRQLVAVNDKLDAAERAVRWQKQRAQLWRRRALRTGRRPASRAAPASARHVNVAARAAPPPWRFPGADPLPIRRLRAVASLASPVRRVVDPGRTYKPKERGRGRGR